MAAITPSGTGTLNTTYAYDANGNMSAGGGRSTSWTAANMVAQITQGASTVTFAYGPEHARIKQVTSSATTYYFADAASGVSFEKVLGTGGAVQWNEYLIADGKMAGEHYTLISASLVTTTKTRYFTGDHLGSIALITDESAAVVERLSYDAWGKRRFANGTDDPSGSITSQTTRGFTGHEMIDQVGLINMNGRVQDPVLGKFLSADPTIQDPGDSQSFNRYSYVQNRPLSATDPTGFCSLQSAGQACDAQKAVENIEEVIITAQRHNPPPPEPQIGLGGFVSSVQQFLDFQSTRFDVMNLPQINNPSQNSDSKSSAKNSSSTRNGNRPDDPCHGDYKCQYARETGGLYLAGPDGFYQADSGGRPARSGALGLPGLEPFEKFANGLMRTLSSVGRAYAAGFDDAPMDSSPYQGLSYVAGFLGQFIDYQKAITAVLLSAAVDRNFADQAISGSGKALGFIGLAFVGTQGYFEVKELTLRGVPLGLAITSVGIREAAVYGAGVAVGGAGATLGAGGGPIVSGIIGGYLAIKASNYVDEHLPDSNSIAGILTDRFGFPSR